MEETLEMHKKLFLLAQQRFYLTKILYILNNHHTNIIFHVFLAYRKNERIHVYIFLSNTWIPSIVSILCFQETNANSTTNYFIDNTKCAVPINEQQIFQNWFMVNRGSMNAQRNISLETTKVLFNWSTTKYFVSLKSK